jgi:hypothetical protein
LDLREKEKGALESKNYWEKEINIYIYIYNLVFFTISLKKKKKKIDMIKIKIELLKIIKQRKKRNKLGRF